VSLYFARCHEINPETGKPYGLTKFETTEYWHFWVRRGGEWVEIPHSMPDDPRLRIFVAGQTAAEFEAEGRRLLWQGLKILLVRWFFYKRDLETIRRIENESD